MPYASRASRTNPSKPTPGTPATPNARSNATSQLSTARSILEVRLATERYSYSAKTLRHRNMHLTNYSINCRNKGKFQFNKGVDDADTGHKRTFTSILDHIQEEYDDGEKKVDELMHKIE